MITAALKALLDAIGKHEAPKGYGQIYGGARGVPMDTDVSKLTLNGVLDFQQRMLDGGSASTACGRYQFLRKTLKATIAEMHLAGGELWAPDLQDRMAIHLMKGRGLDKYLAGQIGREEFANNLAKEWASLPVVTAIKGQKRMLEPGETYYAGDGLNKAFHKPAAILALVDGLRAGVAEVAPQPVPVEPAEEGGKFERVDFYRLAQAFNRSIEEVHQAVGFTGTLYRQRATPDPVIMPPLNEVEGPTQVKLQLAGITPKDYEALRAILKEAQP